MPGLPFSSSLMYFTCSTMSSCVALICVAAYVLLHSSVKAFKCHIYQLSFQRPRDLPLLWAARSPTGGFLRSSDEAAAVDCCLLQLHKIVLSHPNPATAHTHHVCVSLCLSVGLSACMSACLSVCLCVCVSRVVCNAVYSTLTYYPAHTSL